jgi:cation diffusion facilitator family transporter
MNKKVKIARLSILSNSFLIVIKLIVGVFSGSVSIISEAIHSSMDLMASIIAFFAVKISDAPADKEHPYGHGKYENISGVIEAILIIIASFWIIIEAVKKIFDKQPIDSIGFGFVVMFISAGVNFLVSRRLYKVAKETESIALEADALHLKTDIYTSAGVGIGLLLIWITKQYYLDPLVAILVAIFILFEAFQLLRNAYFPLVDAAMAENEIQIIYDAFESKSLRFHDLKTRKAGHYRFAELHLEMSHSLSLKQVHDVCDELETELKSKIKNFEINIHVEPVESEI